MKYNKGKIKREHTIIEDFLPVLKKIAVSEKVERLIPGRIARSQKGSSHFLLSVSYPTEAGLKCIMKKGGSAQELFLIGESDELVEVLKSLFDTSFLRGVERE